MGAIYGARVTVRADPIEWTEVTLEADGEATAQVFVHALFAEGAVSVDRRVLQTASGLVEQIVGTFLHSETSRAAAETLQAHERTIAAPGWSADWLAQQRAIEISPTLAVAPHFVDSRAPLTLRIDPGLAFGTATHPTTQLCLRKLESLLTDPRARRPASLLDVGCGTGVLAIAGLRLGVESAIGTDIDPIALRTARRCARLNQLDDARLVLSNRTPDAHGQHPLVLANLPPEPMELLTPAIARAVANQGTLILSGFFTELVDPITSPFESRGFQKTNVDARAEWAVVCLTRTQDPFLPSPL